MANETISLTSVTYEFSHRERRRSYESGFMHAVGAFIKNHPQIEKVLDRRLGVEIKSQVINHIYIGRNSDILDPVKEVASRLPLNIIGLHFNKGTGQLGIDRISQAPRVIMVYHGEEYTWLKRDTPRPLRSNDDSPAYLDIDLSSTETEVKIYISIDQDVKEDYFLQNFKILPSDIISSVRDSRRVVITISAERTSDNGYKLEMNTSPYTHL